MGFPRLVDRVLDEPTKSMKRLAKTQTVDFEAVAGQLTSDYGWLEFENARKTMLGIFAAIGICMLPPIRAIKMGFWGKKVFESRFINRSKGGPREHNIAEVACFAVGGGAINYTFVNATMSVIHNENFGAAIIQMGKFVGHHCMIKLLNAQSQCFHHLERGGSTVFVQCNTEAGTHDIVQSQQDLTLQLTTAPGN